jgi:hypothetical protein
MVAYWLEFTCNRTGTSRQPMQMNTNMVPVHRRLIAAAKMRCWPIFTTVYA